MGKILCGVTSALLLTGVLVAVGLPSVYTQNNFSPLQNSLQADPISCGSTVNSSGPITLPSSLNVTLCIIGVQRISNESNFSSLIFSHINLQENDVLSVYDGEHNVSSNQVISITGSRDTLVVVLSAPTAYLVVNITSNLSSSTLQATFSNKSCDIQQSVSGPNIVRSPVYLPSRMNFTCSYEVKANQAGSGGGSSAQQLALSFLKVSLPSATLNVTTSSSQTVQVTGKDLPSDVYSSGSLKMLLSVLSVNTSQTFSAALSPIISSSVCGQTKDINGSLTLDVKVPDSHPLPYDCRIVLKAVKGKSLSLNITSLQLAANGDSVVMVDGGSLAGGKVLATFASTTPGYLVLSGQNQVLVRLQVGEMLATRSLTVDVTELDTVGHLYNSGNLVIKPSSGSKVVTQYYLLEASAGSMVKFMLTGEEASKTYSYSVSVYDGCQTSSPLLVTFSSNVRVPVVSSGAKLLVVARLSNTSSSLNASFSTQTAAGCDKVTSAKEGSWQLMTTPSVPSKCRWTMTAPPNYVGTILLDLTMVKLSQKATVSVYSGVAESGSLVARLTATNIMMGAPLPSVAVPASQWAQVVFASGNSTNLTFVAVNVRFQQLDTLCGGQIQAAQGHLRSPAYPNLYPLNAQCTWTFPPSAPGRLLFFDFPSFQLAQNHSLTMVEKLNGTSRVVKSLTGKAELPDVLYASNNTNTVTFSSQPVEGAVVSSQVAQGFDVQFWVLQCGGYTNKSTGSFSTPSFPATNATLCVWFVQLPPKTGNNVNIVNMTVQIKTSGSPRVKDIVKMYDGDSLRKSQIAYNVSGADTQFKVLSRYNSVLIVVNASAAPSASQHASAAAGLALKVNYLTYSCKPKQLCDNGICMHPDWICNGIDDCGDSTDERHCISPPTPTNPKTGTKPGIVVLLFFVGLLLGILLAVIIPKVIRRFRTNRYTAFNNDPAVA